MILILTEDSPIKHGLGFGLSTVIENLYKNQDVKILTRGIDFTDNLDLNQFKNLKIVHTHDVYLNNTNFIQAKNAIGFTWIHTFHIDFTNFYVNSDVSIDPNLFPLRYADQIIFVSNYPKQGLVADV